MIEQQTLQRYAAQLRRGEALSVDQQRTLVDAAMEPFVATKSVEQREQAIRERENNMKAALKDIAGMVEEGVTFAHLNATRGSISTLPIFSRIQDHVAAARTMLRSKSKDMKSWDDWKVMVEEDHGAAV